MKLKILMVMVVGVLLIPAGAMALSIGDQFTVSGVLPGAIESAKVSFGSSTNWYVTDYELQSGDLPEGSLDAFCVEDVDAPSDAKDYVLWDVSSHLQEAAWLADQYWNASGWDYTKEETQIAIWELVLETDSTSNLSSGFFKLHSGASAANINAILGMDLDIPGSGVLLAHNPVEGTSEGYQDYLVQNSVPEPSMMLLMGTGLIGLAGVCRRQFFKA